MAINSSNAVYMLGVASIFPIALQLQGFGTEDLMSGERLESAQTMMGIDGFMSQGFVFVEYKQEITLQADSASSALFDQWWLANQVAQDSFSAFGFISLPGINTKYGLINGALTGYVPIPDAGKLLKPKKYQITWSRVIPQPFQPTG